MKAKTISIFLLIVISFLIPFSLLSFSYGNLHLSAEDIEWGIKEGNKYTWVVRVSNESLGFLPVGSKYEITVTSIRSMNSGNASELNATITRYNSKTKITTTVLNNGTFIYFDNETKTTSFYAPFNDHGFFTTKTDHLRFADGVDATFSSEFGFTDPGRGWNDEQLKYIKAEDHATDLTYWWLFNDKAVSYRLEVDHPRDWEEGTNQYVISLTSSSAIPFESFYLIFMGVAILSLIYSYKKRFK